MSEPVADDSSPGATPVPDVPPPSPEETAAAFSEALRADRFRRELRTGVRDKDTVAMHAWVYGAVMVLLVGLWALVWSAGGTSSPWFLFPAVGWGVVLVAHRVTAQRNRRAPR